VLDTTEYCEQYLQPGEVFFGDHWNRVHTILGSCVSITAWHPLLRIGGMCHYMLARKPASKQPGLLDGRYAEDAVRLLLNEISIRGTHPQEYELKMFGGGHQFDGHGLAQVLGVSVTNVEVGCRLLNEHGFLVRAQHLGGVGHRKLIFDIATGQVWVRHATGENQRGVT
jgi:chemotaxis protein CheD